MLDSQTGTFLDVSKYKLEQEIYNNVIPNTKKLIIL